MAENPEFVDLNNLASSKVGAKILFATDDWFAVAENLLKPKAPEWREDVFTSFGKWMDGWESRRKRKPGHDWSIIKLGIPGVIKGVDVDTSFFTGNYPPRISIQAAALTNDEDFPDRISEMGTEATEEQLEQITKIKTENWTEIVPITPLRPGYPETCHHFLPVNSNQRWTHIRLNYFPDGGCARLRVYGLAVKDWSTVPKHKIVDLAAMENGGTAISWSNMHYGHPRNLIAPGRADNMGDGWETARRLDRPSVLRMGKDGCLIVPGCEWVVIRLGHVGVVTKIEVDTNHFKGNFPDSCVIEGCLMSEEDEKKFKKSQDTFKPSWKVILPSSKLFPHKRHYYQGHDIRETRTISHVKITIAPDGGVSRLRLWGYPSGKNLGSKL